MSAFTTVRVQGGFPLLWERHLERIASTCALLELPEPDEAFHLERIGRVALPDALYRLTVTPEGEFGLYRPLEPLPTSRAMLWLSDVRVHPQLGAHKSGNYLPYLLAGREAERAGCFEALLRSREGAYLVDCSRSALLLEHGGQFMVPLGGLPSVTRSAFLERHAPGGWREQHVTLEELRHAKHVWILGSGVGMLSVDDVRWRSGQVNFAVKRFEHLEPPFLPPEG